MLRMFKDAKRKYEGRDTKRVEEFKKTDIYKAVYASQINGKLEKNSTETAEQVIALVELFSAQKAEDADLKAQKQQTVIPNGNLADVENMLLDKIAKQLNNIHEDKRPESQESNVGNREQLINRAISIFRDMDVSLKRLAGDRKGRNKQIDAGTRIYPHPQTELDLADRALTESGAYDRMCSIRFGIGSFIKQTVLGVRKEARDNLVRMDEGQELVHTRADEGEADKLITSTENIDGEAKGQVTEEIDGTLLTTPASSFSAMKELNESDDRKLSGDVDTRPASPASNGSGKS